jgi:hypothetical protein
MVDTWCEDVLSKGVHRDPSIGGRHTLCPYDKTNMSWSGDALLNSCTVALRTDLETRVAIKDRNGPSLLYEILLYLYRPSHSKIRSLRAQLESLSIQVTQILTDFDELYQTPLHQIDHAPAAPAQLVLRVQPFPLAAQPGVQVQAFVEAVDGIKEQLGKLQQDCHSKPSSGSKPAGSSGACRICGGKDHWANTCPNKGATPSGGPPAGGTCAVAKHGLNDATNLKVIALIKEQKKTLPTRLAIAALYEANSKATDKYDISLNGKVFAKYCLHCGRYTKGTTAHSSAEHSGRTFTPRPCGPAPSSTWPSSSILDNTRDISDCLHLKDSGR